MEDRIKKFKQLKRKVKVGTLVQSIVTTAICRNGEVGVCYEVYDRGIQGFSFIFNGGGYDGFSPQEVENMLKILGQTTEKGIKNYIFRNVMTLTHHHNIGVFDNAFIEADEIIHGSEAKIG